MPNEGTPEPTGNGTGTPGGQPPTGQAPTGTGATPPGGGVGGTGGGNGGAPPAGGEQKPAGGQQAPADFELKLPEGFQANQDAVGKFKAAAKVAGLDGPKAQALFDVYAQAEVASVQRQKDEAQKQLEDWKKAVEGDKDMGGANYQATRASAQKAMEKFASPQLRELMNATGFGEHPEFVRFAAKVGQAISEDNAGATGGGGTTTPQKPTREQRLRNRFPRMAEAQKKENA